MTEFELLVDFHQDAQRQGPGSPETTLKAWELTGLDNAAPLAIADIGCGTGAQTLSLARHTRAHITAVDLFPEFLARLEKEAHALGLEDRITPVPQSMDKLDFGEGQFDLIWSEGAIYIMGFEAGIQNWKRFLKPGGFLAVSEISWITHSRPAEIEAYWQEAYPEIDTVSGKIQVLERSGLVPVAHFILPPACWWDHYYRPMQARFEAFLARHQHSEAAVQLVEQEQTEIRMYGQYQDYYSYGFYIARKP